MVENKQLFLNKLTEALQETRLFGTGNKLVELRLLKDEHDRDFVRPIFEDGSGEDGFYDINVNMSSCSAMVGDIWNQFILRFLGGI